MLRHSFLLGLGCVVLAGACAAPPTSMPRRDNDRSSSPDDSDEEESDDTSKPDDEDDATDEATRVDEAPDHRSIDAFPGSKIFKPATLPAPAIVMLHGSEGGSEPFIHTFAAEVARDGGFVVVSLCWFGCAKKPARIERIPLESVIDAGTWLSKSADVKGGTGSGGVGLFGWSRGGELSLLVTSLIGTKPFRAVAVHAPSDTVVAGFDPATQNQSPNFGGIMERDPKTGNQIPSPAWTFKGQPLFGEPKADFSVAGPKIAVEKYPGAVYVSQGERDEVWPVTRGRAVVATRKTVPTLVTESHFFPNEGHVLTQPNNIAARKSDVIGFFKRNLQ